MLGLIHQSTAVGLMILIVGLEALSSYLLELLFLAQVVTATLER